MAMCVGLAVLDVLYIWAVGRLGYTNPFVQLPQLSVLIVALNMTAPMAAWMRFRGMMWRPIVEMSAAMVIEAILIIGVALLGIIPMSSAVVWQHGMMVPAMVVPMLFRLNLYTGRGGLMGHAH